MENFWNNDNQKSPQSPASWNISQRKKTVTLFIVIGVSVLAMIPVTLYKFLPINIQTKLASDRYKHVGYAIDVIYFTSSIVNPIVYAIRLREFRNNTKKFRKARRSWRGPYIAQSIMSSLLITFIVASAMVCSDFRRCTSRILVQMSTEDPVHSSNAWIVLFIAESIVIVISNALTLLAFAKIRHLRKRSTYLIINLAVADLLVGALTVPISVLYFRKDEDRVLYLGVLKTTIIFIFPLASQVNLCLISMERLHATLFPFRHCLIGKWFYYRGIMGSWLINFFLTAIMAWLDIADIHPEFLYVHGTLIALFVVFIAVSHITVVIK
ncbi:hypothetical protein pdam_00006945, partial [Pocillopora damicornis]